MNIRRLKDIGLELTAIAADYRGAGGPTREMLIDPALYALLRSSAGGAQRQYPAHLPNAKRCPRIDFRVGGPNPVLIEFAVRSPQGGGTLYGSQNKPELSKLTRFGNHVARLRALLLVDLYHNPHSLAELKATYDVINAGRGKFARYPVQIIYAHASAVYSFRWNPLRHVA